MSRLMQLYNQLLPQWGRSRGNPPCNGIILQNSSIVRHIRTSCISSHTLLCAMISIQDSDGCGQRPATCGSKPGSVRSNPRAGAVLGSAYTNAVGFVFLYDLLYVVENPHCALFVSRVSRIYSWAACASRSTVSSFQLCVTRATEFSAQRKST